MRILSLVRKLAGRGREEGQSMVEFALVLPLIIFILFAIVQFGAVLNGLIVLTATAREVARVEAAAEEGDSSGAMNLCQAAPFLTCSGPVISGDQIIEVTVAGSVPVFIPFINAGEIELQGKAAMRREESRANGP